MDVFLHLSIRDIEVVYLEFISIKNNSPLYSIKSKPTNPLRFGKTFKILSIKLINDL